ncbi:MAG: O-antigen ligase family protein [Turicibacter sp.]|nr:O-antigen ligase family protein [Turicibacter sp.]
MKNKYIFIRKNIVWFLLVLFSWLPVLAYTAGNWKGVSFGLYGTVFFVAIFFLLMICKKHTVSRKTLFFGCMIFVVIMFAFFKQTYMLEGGMRDYIYLAIMTLMFGLSFNKQLTNEQIHFLYAIPCYITYAMSFFSFFPSSYDLGSYGNALYLHFQNPNILSFALLNIIIYQILGYIDERKKRYFVAVILACIMLLLTHSRSSLVAVLFLLVVYLNRHRWKKVSPLVAIGVSIIPLIIACFFTINNSVESFKMFGKSGLSGREDIWRYIIETLTSNTKFALFGRGIYMNDCFSDVYENSHNAYLQFICDFGIPLFLIILICIIFLNVHAGKSIVDKYTYVCYFAACSILINCSLETHIADAIIGLTFMWIVLYWINISKKRMKEYDNNCKKLDNKRIVK